MTDCKVENSTIGSGDVTFGSSSVEFSIGNWHVERTNKYCIGGIIGYLGNNSSITNKASTNILKNCFITDNSTVRGGKVKYKSSSNVYTDSDAAIFAGGVIGYNAGISSIGSDLQTSCTVSGHDNVGGIIGYNQTSTIQNLNHTGALSGTGENIGGIVGTNTGGNISNCNNNSAITGSGKSVGGIVGLNNAGDISISNCYNNANVIGNKNVGGIVGITYAGCIDYCGNNSEIRGTKNDQELTNLSLTDDAWYYLGQDTCTGTGGIAGKIYNSTISRSYNKSKVLCNFNAGGIAGITNSGTIKYCYNDGEVTNSGIDSGVKNRLGGICGAAIRIEMIKCYNKANVTGKDGGAFHSNGVSTPLRSGVGGLIGFLVDKNIYAYTDELNLKYNIFIPYINWGTTRSTIAYCYNSGIITGDYQEAIETTHYCGSLVGFIGIGSALQYDTIFVDCCYLATSINRGTNCMLDASINEGQPLNSNNLKNKLKGWSSSSDSAMKAAEYGNKQIYNTTHPFRKNLGYEGYGILWWQFETCTVNFTITKKQNSTNNYNPVFVTAPAITITSSAGENVQATNCISYTTPVRSSDGTKYTFTLTAPKGVELKVNVAEGRDYYTYNGSTYTLSNDNTQNKQVELTSKEIYKVKVKVYGYESEAYTSNPIDITGNATNVELISTRTSTGEATTKTGTANSTTIDVYEGEQLTARVTNSIDGYGSCSTQTFNIPNDATWNVSEGVYYITTKMYARQVNLKVNLYKQGTTTAVINGEVEIIVTTPYRNSQTYTVAWPGNGNNIAICYGSNVTVKAKAQHYDNSSGTNYGQQTSTANNITSDKTITLYLTPHVYSVNDYTPSSTASATVKGGLFNNSIRSRWEMIGSGTRFERLKKGSGIETGTQAEVHGSYDATLTFTATEPSIPEGMSIKNCSIYVKFNIIGLYINGKSPNFYSDDLHLYFNDTYKSNRMTNEDYTELKIYSGNWPNKMELKFVGKASLNTTITYGSVYEFWIEYTYSY